MRVGQRIDAVDKSAQLVRVPAVNDVGKIYDDMRPYAICNLAKSEAGAG